MRRRLTDKGVAALEPRATRYAQPDPELVGHYVRVQPSGAKSFVAVAIDPYKKQRWVTIGPTNRMTIDEARQAARNIIARVREGLPGIEPPPPKPESFQAVAENWMRRHVQAKGLRSEKAIEHTLRIYVFPVCGVSAIFDQSDAATWRTCWTT